jgi:hypothetical protein
MDDSLVFGIGILAGVAFYVWRLPQVLRKHPELPSPVCRTITMLQSLVPVALAAIVAWTT